MDEISTRRIFLGGFLVLLLVMFYTQIIMGGFYLNKAKNNYIRVIPIRSMRGVIYDRNGIAMAYDKASFNIAVVPYQIRNKKEETLNALADYLKVDAKKLSRAYTKGKTGMFTPVNIVVNVSKETALRAKEKFGSNIVINCEPSRFYPHPLENSHLLGYVKPVTSLYDDFKKYDYTSLERAGVSGVEQYYNTYLRGTDGGDLIEVDAAGKRVGFIGQEKQSPGTDIYLSVDSRIQKISYDALNSRRGCVIIMNAQNGELLCMTAYPSFDPNLFISGSAGKYFLDETKPLLNRAIQSTYPMGSIFKPIEALGALEEKEVTPNMSFHCSGALSLGKARFRCWTTHGGQDLYQALAHSCDVYFYTVGRMLGPERIARWAKKFGFDSLTGIDLPFEKPGLVPTPQWKKEKLHDQWYGGDTFNMSIGQGFMHTTPLAMVVGINAFATEGMIVRPHAIMRIDDTEATPTHATQIDFSKKNFDAVKEGIRLVVEAPDGTAGNFKKLNINMHGKTGTAQNSHGLSHGWFIGFFTINSVKYTMGVFIENCGTSHYAAAAGEDILKTIIEQKIL